MDDERALRLAPGRPLLSRGGRASGANLMAHYASASDRPRYARVQLGLLTVF
jgi:hypothetical protein